MRFIQLIIVSLGFMFGGGALHAEEKKNVLLIISDDLRSDLGSYGKDFMVTPNIDSIADQGVLFTRAYVQQAVCSASRASFLSGMRPDSTGADYPYSHYFVNTVIKEKPLMSTHFFNEGYYSRQFGKVHHGGSGGEKLSAPAVGSLKQKKWGDPENQKFVGKKGGKKNFPPYESANVPDNFYGDGKVAEAAVEALGEAAKQDKPFFFTVGFNKPHLPFRAPSKYWDMYDADKIELSQNPELPRHAPDYAVTNSTLKNWKSENTTPYKNISDKSARKLHHAYYASISYMDAQVGKVLDELKRLKLADNTVIMFVSDHGWHLGDQGMWGKTTNFENATKAPMIISVPGLTNKPVKTGVFVEYVDIYPTLADLAGISLPQHLEGTSIKTYLEDTDQPWKKAAFSQFPRGALSDVEGYAMRTDRYRYIEWRHMETKLVLTRELYDHNNDPLESNNIALDERSAELVLKLSAQLKKGWRAALPKGMTNISDNPVAPPAYAQGNEGKARRAAYIKKYGKAPKGATQ